MRPPRRTHHARTVCSRERRVNFNLVMTEDVERVDCIVCLYHLGHYMPLVKLREHQRRSKWRAYVTNDAEAIEFWRDENILAYGRRDSVAAW